MPYIASLLLLGIPLLKLETGMGQMMQCGMVKGCATVHRRTYGVGLMGTFVALVIAWYYSALMSWSWVYLVGGFADPLPWAGGFDAAKLYFHESVLDRSVDLHGGLGACHWKVALGLAATWTCVYFCIWKGVKSIGPVLYVTIPLPFVLLFVLMIRGVTLPGAAEGLRFYLGRWDWSAYGDGSIYVEAASQIFFSLSLAQGVMQAYSSSNPRDSKYVSNAWIIGLANSGASIFAGFALFSTLGYLSRETGVSIEKLANPGFDLGFITYPTAIAMFGKGWSQVFTLLFFMTLLMLGIDSAFSLVEVLMSPLMDLSSFCRRNRSIVSLAVCVSMYLLSLVFATRGGFWVLEIVDHYIISYAVIAVGILECLLMTYGYGLKRFNRDMKKLCNEANNVLWFHSIKILVPGILGILLLYNIILEALDEGPTALKAQPGWSKALFGWIFCVALPFLLLPLGYVLPWPDAFGIGCTGNSSGSSGYGDNDNDDGDGDDDDVERWSGKNGGLANEDSLSLSRNGNGGNADHDATNNEKKNSFRELGLVNFELKPSPATTTPS